MYAKKMEDDPNIIRPPVSTMSKLRGNRKLYILVCERFMKTVIGEDRWNCNHLVRPLKEFVTPSDEAFLMLVLENNEDRWIDMCINSTKESEVLAK